MALSLPASVVARDWFTEAAVRSSPSPTRIRPDDGAWFAAELQPHVMHPRVRSMGPQVETELLRRALGHYLHATSVLEVLIVNRVAADIAHGTLEIGASPTDRRIALRLYCDEGYHALVAAEMLARVDDREPRERPAFAERLDKLCALHATDEDDMRRLRLLFTVITETSISANMRDLAANASLAPAVREFVAEHARDEAWHAAVFSALFVSWWPTLGDDTRERYGRLLPDLVCAYLEPDTRGVAQDLVAVGLAPRDVASVLAEAYPRDAVRASIRRSARPVLSCFRRAGALAGNTLRAFVRAGLVEGGN